MTTPQQARELAKNLRTKPTPLSVVVPVLQSLADQVEALTAELNNVGLPKLAMCPACMEEVSMLQCDQLTQDAKRYRWLRSQNWHDSDMAVVCYPKVSVKLGAVCPSSELLDEAIDAAIAKGTDHG